MNVLHHLAIQFEALVILLQETHCTDAEKLVLPNYQLSGCSLSRKHGLATFVHKHKTHAFGPISTDIRDRVFVCGRLDVDGYKIFNVYKPPPTRLRTLNLPVFPHPCLYAGNFNYRHADWSYDDNSLDGECLAGWVSINCLALLYLQILCCRLIHLMWMRLTRTSVTPLRKQPKRLSHAGIKITKFCVRMQSVNPSIKPSYSLLRETTQIWLLKLCLPSLTGSVGIDGPKQFGALTSHTLVEKRGVFKQLYW